MTMPHAHESLISVIVIAGEPGQTLACIEAIEGALAAVAHEVVVVYRSPQELHSIDQRPELANRLRLIAAGKRTQGGAMEAGCRAGAGDVLVPFVPGRHSPILATTIAELAAAVRASHAAIAIATLPRATGALRVVDWFLDAGAEIGAGNASSGFRAYAAEFLDHQHVESETFCSAAIELAIKAQFERAGICAVGFVGNLARRDEPIRPLLPWLWRALQAPLLVWGLWFTLAIAALLAGWLARPARAAAWGGWIEAALPAAAAFALTLAIRRVRGRTRIADAFFPLVLLNPMLFAHRAPGFEQMLLGAGLLGLMAGAIIAMKRDNFVRYLAVALLAICLTWVSENFIMMLPPIVAWLVYGGFTLARSPRARDRTLGFLVMAAAEADLMVFLLAAMLAEPTAAPPAATLFSTIVSYAEFPILVLAIALLALGWRRGPSGTTPPYFYGVLALLFGLLTMLLNHFQAGTLPPPSTDQMVLDLCLLYTVFALHGPRRLQWVAPPILLVAAATYTFFRR